MVANSRYHLSQNSHRVTLTLESDLTTILKLNNYYRSLKSVFAGYPFSSRALFADIQCTRLLLLKVPNKKKRKEYQMA